MKLLIATTNLGKVREFREMLSAAGMEFGDLSAHGDLPEAEETGRTFRANACLKATHYARLTGLWTVADDSGLEVDAINCRPGVYSARWAAMNNAGKGDADNNALLLRQIESVADDARTGRFVCVLALADPEGRTILTARDTVEGRIGRSPRGSNGFGYDPLFIVNGLGKTAAELPADEKHKISHRGKALRRLRGLLATLGPTFRGQGAFGAPGRSASPAQ